MSTQQKPRFKLTADGKLSVGVASEAAYAQAIGKRLRAARGTMTASQAAEVLGVHRNTLWNIERGHTTVNAYQLVIMGKAYGTSAYYLLSGVAGDGS